jgi:ABC-type uncharacterized transport system ATPase subunit
MSFRKAATAIGVIVAILGASTMAQAAPVSSASRLSVSSASANLAPGARVGAVRKGESKAGGSAVLLVLAGLAVAAGIYVAVDGGDSDSN